MHARHRLTALVLAVVAIVLCALTARNSQDQMGSNAETWADNFAKWHQGPLLAIVLVVVVVAVASPLRTRTQIVAARVGATIVLLAGFVKSPWILAAFLFMDIFSATGLAALGAILLGATSAAIFIGTSKRPVRTRRSNGSTDIRTAASTDQPERGDHSAPE